MTYLRPVRTFTGISSWSAHQHRTTPSSEPGVDYYCPIGTPVYAPASGVVGMTGDSIIPATGRFVFIKFDNGQSGRALHLSRRVVNTGTRVRAGQLIGYSGATGYGTENWSSNPATGGAHVHWTLWPTHNMRFGYDANGRPYTLDHERYVATTSGGNASPFPDEEEDMPITDDEVKKIARAVWAQAVGERDNQWTSYGTAGGLLAQTHARAGNAATRTAALMAEASGPLTSTQVAALAAALKADLGKTVAAELAKRLAS